jgi:L-iditol 2-dehydrogenase
VTRAAAITRARHAEIGPVELPPPGPGEVLLSVEACGICGTNLRAWIDPAGEPDPGASARPGANGHEVVGTTEAGERVVVEPLLATACGACRACSAGRPWFCRERRAIPVWGFADAMTVPERAALPVPPALSPATASLAEPLACAVHAIRSSWTARGGAFEGSSVAVLGAGVTGLLALVAARELGAGSVAVLARHDHQASAAQALGADAVVRDGAELRGTRPAVVVEAVGGTADTFALALSIVAGGGELAVLGLFDEPQSLDPRRALFRELRVGFPIAYGSSGGVADFDVALEILGRRHAELDRLVTHRFGLDRVADAFAAAADKSTGSLRVVVEP